MKKPFLLALAAMIAVAAPTLAEAKTKHHHHHHHHKAAPASTHK